MDFHVEVGSNSKDSGKGLLAHDGSIGGEEVLTRDLREALHIKAGFVLHDLAICVAFDEKDPTSTDKLAIRW